MISAALRVFVRAHALALFRRRMPGGMENMSALVYRGTPGEELAQRLGVKTIRFELGLYGIALDGAASVATTNAADVDGLQSPGGRAGVDANDGRDAQGTGGRAPCRLGRPRSRWGSGCGPNGDWISTFD